MRKPSPAVVRQWARDRGLPVGDRGRLSPDLVAAYLDERGPAGRPAPPAASRGVPRPRSAEPARSGGRVVWARTPWNWPVLERGGEAGGGAG